MMDGDTVAADMDRRCRKRRARSCRSFASCISPRFIFSRWFNGGNSRGDKNEMGKNWEMPKIGGNFCVDRRRVNGSMGFGWSPSFTPKSSEETGKEASFNLGVGFSLMFLIAASRNELTKMVNLHRQIQILLQSFRTEFQNNQEKEHCSDSMTAPSFPNPSDVQEISYAEKTVCSQYLSSHNFESPQVNFSGGQHIRENSRGIMDQIGNELEAELDRMQLQIDTEIPSTYSKHQHSEINVEDSAPEMSLATGFEDMGKQPYQLMMCNQDQFYGIDPFELERRLHQVLEARQQEEINELIHQLELKEAELSWWKDTVRLISQHAEEPF